jgi:hypothetical protein
MEYYYFLLFIFGLLGWFIVTDESVKKAFVYLTDFTLTKYRMWKWWLLNNPKNPIVKYFMWRRSMKMAKELAEYFDEKKINEQKQNRS